MKKYLYRRFLAVILCLLGATVAFAQGRNVTGTVKDETGAPLAGATVSVKNQNINTLTNAVGLFSLNVPASSRSLVISFVGRLSKEVAISSNNVVNVSLEAGGVNLNDVVVVGYGTAKKANLTTSQTAVTAKEINRTVNTTVEQAIQGRAAGVYITQNSGQPGGGIS